MAITDTYNRDANQIPITGLDLIATKTITYVELTTGVVGATNLFTITGTVALRIFAICDTSLTGVGATLEVGIAGATNGLIAQTTGTDIDAGMVWIDATPATIQALPALSILDDKTIIQTIGTNPVTAGVINYYCC